MDGLQGRRRQFRLCRAEGLGKQGGASGAIRAGVLFRHDKATIDITSDLAGSLMGDMAAATRLYERCGLPVARRDYEY